MYCVCRAQSALHYMCMPCAKGLKAPAQGANSPECKFYCSVQGAKRPALNNIMRSIMCSKQCKEVCVAHLKHCAVACAAN